MPHNHTLRLGLTGWPLGHSLSPRIYRAAMRSLGIKGEYNLYPVPTGGEGKAGLVRLFEKLRSGDLRGLNVTIPYKVEILDLIDRLSPAADAIGAANTLYVRDDRVTGDNTDAAGFMSDLHALFPQLFSLEGEKTGLILGSGGAARAAAYGLLQNGWQAVVASRSTGRGRDMADRLMSAGNDGNLRVIRLTAQSLTGFIEQQEVTLIVNATPVGMAPASDRSPWPLEVPFPEKAGIYDLVYSPAETVLVKAARQSGLQAYTGLGMLVEQAACAFEIWTGIKPDQAYLLEELQKEAASK
jgi:shikimate dehydrogenase